MHDADDGSEFYVTKRLSTSICKNMGTGVAVVMCIRELVLRRCAWVNAWSSTGLVSNLSVAQHIVLGLRKWIDGVNESLT